MGLAPITKIALLRARKSNLEKRTVIYPDQCIIVEMNDDDPIGIDPEELFKLKLRRKYKIGDGIHRYSELPYEEGLMPVTFAQCKSSYLKRLESNKTNTLNEMEEINNG